MMRRGKRNRGGRRAFARKGAGPSERKKERNNWSTTTPKNIGRTKETRIIVGALIPRGYKVAAFPEQAKHPS